MYLTIPAVREKLDVSRSTVQTILAEMRRHPERYGPKDIPHRGAKTWVDEDALIDWLAYGEARQGDDTKREGGATDSTRHKKRRALRHHDRIV